MTESGICVPSFFPKSTWERLVSVYSNLRYNQYFGDECTCDLLVFLVFIMRVACFLPLFHGCYRKIVLDAAKAHGLLDDDKSSNGVGENDEDDDLGEASQGNDLNSTEVSIMLREVDLNSTEVSIMLREVDLNSTEVSIMLREVDLKSTEVSIMLREVDLNSTEVSIMLREVDLNSTEVSMMLREVIMSQKLNDTFLLVFLPSFLFEHCQTFLLLSYFQFTSPSSSAHHEAQL